MLAERSKDKGKLYDLHAPEVEWIGKGKVRQPYGFAVKAGIGHVKTTAACAAAA